MIKRFRDWMHGRGRTAVMVVVAALALCMAIDFYREKDEYHVPAVAIHTESPDSAGVGYIGGDQLAPAPTGTAVPRADADGRSTASPGSTASPEREQISQEKGIGSGTENSAICLGFAGDICLDETSAVMRHMEKKGGLDKVISPGLIQKMNGYDAMVINNEFSVSTRGKKMAGKAYTFRSSPSNLKYLKQLGVDVAGLANNHIYDYGKNAFLDTLHHLKNAGFQTVGAGENIREAKRPAYLKIKGKTIAILAATRAEKFRTYQDRQYVKEIRKAKKKADYVIAYVHWGTEYSTSLEDAQIQQARDYIDAGADAVVGAHTHCMQGIGFYKDVPIFYSLGNFWFNEKTLYTTVLEISIDSSGKLGAKMVPCLQRGKETRILRKPGQIKKFIKHINSISSSGKLDGNCNVIKRKRDRANR